MVLCNFFSSSVFVLMSFNAATKRWLRGDWRGLFTVTYLILGICMIPYTILCTAFDIFYRSWCATARSPNTKTRGLVYGVLLQHPYIGIQ